MSRSSSAKVSKRSHPTRREAIRGRSLKNDRHLACRPGPPMTIYRKISAAQRTHRLISGFSSENRGAEVRQIRRPRKRFQVSPSQHHGDTMLKEYSRQRHSKCAGTAHCRSRHGALLPGSTFVATHSQGVSTGCERTAPAGRKKLPILASFGARSRRDVRVPLDSSVWCLGTLQRNPHHQREPRLTKIEINPPRTHARISAAEPRSKSP